MMENGDVVLAFLDCQPLEGYRSIRLKAGHPEEVDITMADGRQRTIVAHRDQGLAVQGDPAYRLAVGHVVSCKQKCNRVCEHAAAAQASGASVKFPLVARCRIPSSQT
ncbi:unnamed protein product [Ostreobium quekettii]|uniref:Uncharacterized protein n=1 Tax=Ostreobium quekettii TaxID=121088 RepID=A0A8S1IUY8_9CHLO|nr:unnamed protein product [Ostreobium quekettii]